MTRFGVLAGITTVMLSVLCVQPMQSSQTSKPAPPPRPPAELLRLSLAAEKEGLAEPFKGNTANGQIEPNLFGVRSTGVSTEPVRAAADVFLASLTTAQRDATAFPIDAHCSIGACTLGTLASSVIVFKTVLMEPSARDALARLRRKI